MKLTVLTDNNTYIDRYYLGEPAVSYYIEDEGTKVLFDAGYSDVYLRNAEALGIDLCAVDAIVLSHGHNDHTRGLTFFPQTADRKHVYAHPLAFEQKEADGLDIGSVLSREQMSERFELHLSAEPVRISEHLLFLGEIERTTDFENLQSIGSRLVCGRPVPDYLPDDSALVYESTEGIYIITGCSHAGICNILEYAKKVTGRSRICGVIGGFHLMDAQSVQLRKTVDYFARADIRSLYPCHCTCFAAKAAIHASSPVIETGVGLTLHW